MRIDVSEIKGHKGAQLDRRISVDCEQLGIDGLEQQCLRPLDVQAVVTNIGDGTFSVDGHVECELELVCSRCLEPFTYHLLGEFSEEFFLEGGERHEQWQRRQEEAGNHPADEQIRFYSGNRLDLTDTVRDAVMLAVPMKIVCRDECQGICPVCGQNKNQHQCSCQADDVDLRWTVLKDFLHDDK